MKFLTQSTPHTENPMPTPRPWLLTLALLGVLGLTGCAATATTIKYRNLDIQTRLSASVFLAPTPPGPQTVWIHVKNSSNSPLDFAPLTALLEAKGYEIVSEPQAARYQLQLQVLYLGKASPAEVDQSLAAGFGGAVLGAAAGAAVSGTGTGAGLGAAASALFEDGAELVANALVTPITYTVILDLQLSEPSDTAVTTQSTTTFDQGGGRADGQSHATTETGRWRHHRSRVATTATQVNLAFETARPALEAQLTRTLASLF